MRIPPGDGRLPEGRRSRPADAAGPENSGPLAVIRALLALWDPNGNRLAPENRRVLAPVAVRFHLSLGEHSDSW